MWSALNRALQRRAAAALAAVTSWEFWIYVALVLTLALLALACAYLAINFDTLTRNKLMSAVACNTGERQIGTIIIGAFVFGIASLFTLGEVTHWVEEKRQARAPGRHFTISFWRPLLHVIGTVAIGVGGFLLMSAWCS